MDLSFYKEYRFIHGKFVSDSSGKTYSITMPKGDRFYDYMRKHFINEKVEGLTREMIDDIFIEDPDKSFFDENTFTLVTDMLATKGNIVHSFAIVIKRLRLDEIDVSKKTYENGRWILNLCRLVIPYSTDIDIKEVKDE